MFSPTAGAAPIAESVDIVDAAGGTGSDEGGGVDPQDLTFTCAFAMEYLPEDALRRISGEEDLEDVTEITLEVDASDNAMGDLGRKLPALQRLRLSGSVVPWLRDLGTHLNGLRVLWVNNVGLRRLDGACALPMLEELYAAFNDVSDLSPLSALSELWLLDLEGNCISDVSEVQFLAECTQLSHLSLNGNPVADVPKYRRKLRAFVPSLECLDDEDLSSDIDSDAEESEESGDYPAVSPMGASNSADGFACASPVKTGAGVSSLLELLDTGAGRWGSSPTKAADAAEDPVASSESSERRLVHEAVKLAQVRRPPPPPPTAAASRRRRIFSASAAMPDAGGASALTHGSRTVFCGLPSRKLRTQRASAPAITDDFSLRDPGLREAEQWAREVEEELNGLRRAATASAASSQAENLVCDTACSSAAAAAVAPTAAAAAPTARPRRKKNSAELLKALSQPKAVSPSVPIDSIPTTASVQSNAMVLEERPTAGGFETPMGPLSVEEG